MADSVFDTIDLIGNLDVNAEIEDKLDPFSKEGIK